MGHTGGGRLDYGAWTPFLVCPPSTRYPGARPRRGVCRVLPACPTRTTTTKEVIGRTSASMPMNATVTPVMHLPPTPGPWFRAPLRDGEATTRLGPSSGSRVARPSQGGVAGEGRVGPPLSGNREAHMVCPRVNGCSRTQSVICVRYARRPWRPRAPEPTPAYTDVRHPHGLAGVTLRPSGSGA